MRSRNSARILILLFIPMFLMYCVRPDVGSRSDHQEPGDPSVDDIQRCTKDPLKQCVPVPADVAAKIKDPNNLTAEDQRFLDEIGAATDGQIQQKLTDLDKAMAAFKADIEVVQKQIGADVPISPKYHAHVPLFAGNSAPAAVPYDIIKANGLPLKWVEDYYRKHPPLLYGPDLERRPATEEQITKLIKDLAERPDPPGTSFTQEELDALVARTVKLRGEDSRENFLGSLAFKSDDLYVVVFGRNDIVVYAKDRDIRRMATNNWIAPRVPLNIYRAYYSGKVGTDPGKTLDERIDQSVARTLKNYRDMKSGEIAAIVYMIFSALPITGTAVELDNKLCGQPGSSWFKVAGSFFSDVGLVLSFFPGRMAFAMMIGADGAALGMLYLDGDPKNASAIKWQAGFLAMSLVFRGGPLLRAGTKILGKVPVVTTAIKSYNALLAAFKALNTLLKKKCYLFPKKLGRVAGATDDIGSVLVEGPSATARITTDVVTETLPVIESDEMDDANAVIDAEMVGFIAEQSADTLDGTCDCVCKDAPAEDPDEIAEDELCTGSGGCCHPDDLACTTDLSPTAEISITP